MSDVGTRNVKQLKNLFEERSRVAATEREKEQHWRLRVLARKQVGRPEVQPPNRLCKASDLGALASRSTQRHNHIRAFRGIDQILESAPLSENLRNRVISFYHSTTIHGQCRDGSDRIEVDNLRSVEGILQTVISSAREDVEYIQRDGVNAQLVQSSFVCSREEILHLNQALQGVRDELESTLDTISAVEQAEFAHVQSVAHPDSVLFRGLVRHDFHAESNFELTASRGDSVDVLEIREDGWVLVKLDEESIGWIPMTSIERVDEDIRPNGNDMVVFGRDTLPSESDRNRALHYIDEESKLFSEVQRGTTIEVYTEDLDELLVKGQTLEGAMTALMQLDRSLIRVLSFDELKEHVIRVVEEWNDHVIPQVESLIVSSAVLSRLQISAWSLLTRTTCGVAIIDRIKEVDWQNTFEGSESDVIALLKSAQTSYDAHQISDRQEQVEIVHNHLHNARTSLFSSGTGINGPDIVARLEEFAEREETFESLYHMMVAIWKDLGATDHDLDQLLRLVACPTDPEVEVATDFYPDPIPSSLLIADDKTVEVGTRFNARVQRLMTLLTHRSIKLFIQVSAIQGNLKLAKQDIIDLLSDDNCPCFAFFELAMHLASQNGLRVSSLKELKGLTENDFIRDWMFNVSNRLLKWSLDSNLESRLESEFEMNGSKEVTISRIVLLHESYHPCLPDLMEQWPKLSDLSNLQQSLRSVGRNIVEHEERFEADVIQLFETTSIFDSPIDVSDADLDLLISAVPNCRPELVMPALQSILVNRPAPFKSIHELAFELKTHHAESSE